MSISKLFLLLSCIFLCYSCDTSDPIEGDNNNTDSPVEKEEDNLCTLIKWKGYDVEYFITSSGYIAYSEHDNNTSADALINDESFHFEFDENNNLVKLKSRLLNIYIDYYGDDGKGVPCIRLFGDCYGIAFSEFEYLEDEKQDNKSRGPIENATNWLSSNFKTAIVTRAVNRIGKLETSAKDSNNEFVRKHLLQGTVKKLIGMTGQIDEAMKNKDKSAIEIVNEIEKEYPDMGGVQYLFAATIEYGKLNPIYSMSAKQILRWIKKIQDNNKKLQSDREDNLNKPMVLFGISSWCYPEAETCSFGFDGIFKVIGGHDSTEFEYGLFLKEENSSEYVYYPFGSFTTSSEFEISPTIPSSKTVTNLKKGTTYLYGTYCRTANNDSAIYEDAKSFTTSDEFNYSGNINLNITNATAAKLPGNRNVNVTFACSISAEYPTNITGIEEWGIYTSEDNIGIQYYSLNNNNTAEAANIDVYRSREQFDYINYKEHTATSSVSIGVWIRLKNEKCTRLGKIQTKQLIYNQPVSISFINSNTFGDTYPAVTTYEDEDGNLRTATMFGTYWYNYTVSIKASGCLFIDQLSYICNQYEYGTTGNYANGLIYSDILWNDNNLGLHDGNDNSFNIRQLTCPSGSATVDGKVEKINGYSENWEWYMYESDGDINYSTNSIHYFNWKDSGMKFTSDYKKEIDVYLGK